MNSDEEWYELEHFPRYRINRLGEIRHHDRTSLRRTSENHRGFPIIQLFAHDNNVRYLRQVNKLVAETFLMPKVPYLRHPHQYYLPEHKDYSNFPDARFVLRSIDSADSVWHLDGDIKNVHADNLMWASRSEVLEWNKMNRPDYEPYKTPKVRNNKTGRVYKNAFECGIYENELETRIITRIERQARYLDDENAPYCYLI